jgi:hypothetical protein
MCGTIRLHKLGMAVLAGASCLCQSLADGGARCLLRLQAYAGRLQVDEMLSAACSAAQLGSGLPPACLRVLCDKLSRALK